MLEPGPVRQRRADIGLLPDRNSDRVTPCKPKNGQPLELYDYKTRPQFGYGTRALRRASFDDRSWSSGEESGKDSVNGRGIIDRT